jgi:hypothetical protein
MQKEFQPIAFFRLWGRSGLNPFKPPLLFYKKLHFPGLFMKQFLKIEIIFRETAY